MSRPVEERLRELDAELEDLRLMPPGVVRDRGRRRGRRQLAALAVAGAVVAVTAGATAITTQRHAAPAGARPANGCVVALPDDPAAVRLRVVDGGATPGVSDTTETQLLARRFTVLAATTGDKITGVATLRYGPAAIGAAALLRAELHGDVTMLFEPDRRDEVVDLIIGPAFTRLATPTETNQTLASAGKPTAPAECSAVN